MNKILEASMNQAREERKQVTAQPDEEDELEDEEENGNDEEGDEAEESIEIERELHGPNELANFVRFAQKEHANEADLAICDNLDGARIGADSPKGRQPVALKQELDTTSSSSQSLSNARTIDTPPPSPRVNREHKQENFLMAQLLGSANCEEFAASHEARFEVASWAGSLPSQPSQQSVGRPPSTPKEGCWFSMQVKTVEQLADASKQQDSDSILAKLIEAGEKGKRAVREGPGGTQNDIGEDSRATEASKASQQDTLFHSQGASAQRSHHKQHQRHNERRHHSNHHQRQHQQQQQQQNYFEQQKQAPEYDNHDVKLVDLFGIKIVALIINGKERLCLAQISNTLLKEFSYNEIHNRRVALGITCVQCTPIQLEMLRRAGAMPSSSRRCGMITMREAERLCRSFLAEEQPPELPENFYFTVAHRVNYGCKGRFVPARYISSRAKCIECFYCGEFYSPNKFIFHSHKQPDATDCNPPDSPNINSWRKHINLDWAHEHSQEIKYAWEDVKSLFNGGTRRRTGSSSAAIAAAAAAAAATLNIIEPTVAAATGGSVGKPAATTPKDSGLSQKMPTSEEAAKGINSTSHRTSASRKRCVQASHDGESQRSQQATIASEQQAATTCLTQNERRKLPIGAWPRDCQQIVASQGSHLHNHAQLQHHQSHHKQSGAQDSQMGQTVGDEKTGPLKRSAMHMSVNQQQHNQGVAQHQIKKLTHQNDWQHKPPANQPRKPAFVDPLTMQNNSDAEQQQQSNIYNHHLAGAFAYGKAMAGQNVQMSQPGANKQSSLNNLKFEPQIAARIVNNRDAGQQRDFNLPDLLPLCLAQSFAPNASLMGTYREQSSPTPSGFIYGQLYSHLIQSQIAQQQQQQQVSQQQTNFASMETQLALRQHIWSSLLANLRGEQTSATSFANDPANLHNTKSSSTQMQTYDFASNSLVQQQQQSSSILAAAAAARNHQQAPNPQHQNIESSDLANLHPPPSIGGCNMNLNNLMSMRLYTTSTHASGSDMAAFNGEGNCK